MIPERQLLRALWVAIRHGDHRWQRFCNAVHVLWLNRYGIKAEPWIISERNMRCVNCLIFYAPLSTCGSPLDPATNGMGCFCHTPTKNKLLHTHCWAYDNTNGKEGWPAALNL